MNSEGLSGNDSNYDSNYDSNNTGNCYDNPQSGGLVLRAPVAADGYHVHRLVAQCAPLDPNSLYCNLLQCSHFSATSVAAILHGKLVGFVSGYCLPERPTTLFVWQVAVGDAARGRGLATQMIRFILAQPACGQVTGLETTITADNDASWALFRGLAAKLGIEVTTSTLFERDTHFQGDHESEILVRLGPFAR